MLLKDHEGRWGGGGGRKGEWREGKEGLILGKCSILSFLSHFIHFFLLWGLSSWSHALSSGSFTLSYGAEYDYEGGFFCFFFFFWGGGGPVSTKVSINLITVIQRFSSHLCPKRTGWQAKLSRYACVHISAERPLRPALSNDLGVYF